MSLIYHRQWPFLIITDNDLNQHLSTISSTNNRPLHSTNRISKPTHQQREIIPFEMPFVSSRYHLTLLRYRGLERTTIFYSRLASTSGISFTRFSWSIPSSNTFTLVSDTHAVSFFSSGSTYVFPGKEVGQVYSKNLGCHSYSGACYTVKFEISYLSN